MMHGALEEEGLPRNPNLELAQALFTLQHAAAAVDPAAVEQARSEIMEGIQSHDMAPFYEEVCASLGWPVDAALAARMREANEAKLKELEAAVEDATKNLGESEMRDALHAKASYLCAIGAKDASLTAFRLTADKTVTIGSRLDLAFNLIRIGIFYMDHDLIRRNLEKAQSMIEEGGDWDRRNRLKVYEGLYAMTQRDFKKAARLMLDSLATFTSTELLSYKQFITYATLSSMVALSRVELRTKVIQAPAILEAMYDLPLLSSYVHALYDCKYDEFFVKLAEVETEMKRDRYLAQHTHFYVREMRIRAYAQLLQSYYSVTLSSMAASFGVSESFLDGELARFIASGRLHCKIDKVEGIVTMDSPEAKQAQYQDAIRQGDLLLNRIQRLSRVINI